MCGFFAWGGEGAVVAEFLLDPPTHKKSETGNRATLEPNAWRLTPGGKHLTPETLRLAVNAGAWRLTLALKAKRWCMAVSL